MAQWAFSPVVINAKLQSTKGHSTLEEISIILVLRVLWRTISGKLDKLDNDAEMIQIFDF